jgi:hypothetical protein
MSKRNAVLLGALVLASVATVGATGASAWAVAPTTQAPSTESLSTIQSKAAAASDQIGTNAIPKLTAASTKAAGYKTSTNQATLAPLLADLNSQIASATTSVSGVATTVLGYTPVQWNANQDLLAASKSSVSSAQTAVKKAVSDLQQIRTAVKAGK